MSITNSELVLANRVTSAITPAARPDWLSPALFPFRSRFVDAEGTHFHYVDEGSGPTLLFVHGAPMSSFMWRHPLSVLRASHRCVAVDLPGLGGSKSLLVRGKGFARNADALQAFVRALDLDDFTLIIHSTGGPSSLEMAVRERDRLRGLVISNTFAWPLAPDPGVGTMVRIVSSRLFRFLVVRLNLLARIAARIGRRHGTFSAEERAVVLGPFRQVETRAVLANLLYGLRVETPFLTRLEGRLPELADVPTLLLFSDEDNGYRAGFMDRFARMLPSHASVVLHAAHFLTEDAPEAYTAALEGWLAERPSRTKPENA
jgi:haloalkane dehalogenase